MDYACDFLRNFLILNSVSILFLPVRLLIIILPLIFVILITFLSVRILLIPVTLVVLLFLFISNLSVVYQVIDCIEILRILFMRKSSLNSLMHHQFSIRYLHRMIYLYLGVHKFTKQHQLGMQKFSEHLNSLQILKMNKQFNQLHNKGYQFDNFAIFIFNGYKIRQYIIQSYMKVVILFALIFCFATCDKWALLVAGSNTWSNYRHQADVYHSYQSLIAGGFDPNNIITFAYDDIANSTSNPFKGKVFNKPTFADPGVDVYGGVKIDYKGADVTPQNFLAVIEGNSTATKGKKVLKLTPSDNLFIFFSDHGGVGLIAFPSKYLYADVLLKSFDKIKGTYGKIVFYLETCESGSMFQKLPTNTKIYALSAANPTESSWGTYCSPNDIVQGKHIGSCLGDLFSVNFIQDLDKANYNAETLNDQFQLVKKLTSLSQVMQWGDLSFTGNKVGQFVASPKQMQNNLRFIKRIGRVGTKHIEGGNMNSRTMKLQSLAALYARDHSQQTFLEMKQEMASMQRLDSIFNNLQNSLSLTGSYDVENINFPCLRETVETYEKKCEKLSDYGLTYVKDFAEACQSYQSQQIISRIKC